MVKSKYATKMHFYHDQAVLVEVVTKDVRSNCKIERVKNTRESEEWIWNSRPNVIFRKHQAPNITIIGIKANSNLGEGIYQVAVQYVSYA